MKKCCHLLVKSDLCRDACPQIFNNCTGYQKKKLRLLGGPRRRLWSERVFGVQQSAISEEDFNIYKKSQTGVLPFENIIKLLRVRELNHETQGPPDQITVTASIARELSELW